MKKVLFVCVHNAGRSQMAEALFNLIANNGVRAESAGTKPASEVNPVVVQAMAEVGIDISTNRPRLLTFEMIEDSERVITMGCGVEESCPASFVPSEDWELDDPAGQPIEKVRQIRDEIKSRVQQLLRELN